MPIQDLDKLVGDMDELNMAVMVNLSGFRGKYLEWSLENVKDHYETRFAVFLNLILKNWMMTSGLKTPCHDGGSGEARSEGIKSI